MAKLKLQCPVCGRKRTVTVRPGTRRTIRCSCGKYTWTFK